MQNNKGYSSFHGGSPAKTEAHRLVEERLEQALEKLKEQNEFIKQVSTTPAMHGICVGYVPEDKAKEKPAFVDVIFNGSMARMPKLIEEKIEPFDSVLIVQGGGLVGKINDALPPFGRVVTVKQVVSDEQVEVLMGGDSAVVRHLGDFEVEEGDRVVLDTTMTLILQTVPKPPAPTANVHVERVMWSDIGGQHMAKAELEEAIIWPKKYGKTLAAYGQGESKGILLWGPPGCGKTLIAKAVATEIAGPDGAPGFISVRGPELMNPYVGETERQIRQLFDAARKHFAEHGTRATIFIDEADSCLGHRGHRLHSDISVPAFLVEMDGISGEGQPLVILATNRPRDLDDAIVREGRIDRKVEVRRPNREEVVELFQMYLAKRPHADRRETVLDKFVSQFEQTILLWDKRSGALVKGLVDRATSFAMKRDIASGVDEPTGISLQDVSLAVEAASLQNNLGGH